MIMMQYVLLFAPFFNLIDILYSIAATKDYEAFSYPKCPVYKVFQNI